MSGRSGAGQGTGRCREGLHLPELSGAGTSCFVKVIMPPEPRFLISHFMYLYTWFVSPFKRGVAKTRHLGFRKTLVPRPPLCPVFPL